MIARLPQSWAAVDLLHAAQLARALADAEANRKLLLREGQIIKGKPNPRLALIEVLTRRSLSLTRILQIHAVANVPKREQGGEKGEAAAAAAALQADPSTNTGETADLSTGKPRDLSTWSPDDLLARPRRLQ
jgi:hypothetical protein